MTAPISSTSTSPQRIGIIGAGLAGLSFTLLLSHIPNPARPLHVTILESRSRHSADGGYLALAPNALHVLDQLGLYQKLRPQGYAYEDIAFVSARNLSRIGTARNGDVERYGYPALRISRGTVRGELIQAVEALCAKSQKSKPGFRAEMRFDAKVASIAETGKKGEQEVNVTLASGEKLTFDFVIGADGIHSKARNLINSEVQPKYSGMCGIGGGRLNRKDIDAGMHLPAMIMGQSNAFMMMPTVADGSEVTCFATMEMDERDREGWAKLGEDKEELKRTLVDRHCGQGSQWPSVVTQACENSKEESLTLWPHYNAPILDSWTTPSHRVILLGDSAHAMPPTGGQGAAMAFEDAASLAMAFSRSSGAAELNEQISEWQVARQARVRKIKAFTAQGGDMRRATPSVFQQVMKEWAMWAYFWVKGKDSGLAWVYEHKEECPGGKVGN